MPEFNLEELLMNYNKKGKAQTKEIKIVINGKDYFISSTREIRVEGEDIYINGDKVKLEPKNDKINITILGDIENLKIGSCNNFKVEGNITTILSSIRCDNLVGDIEKVNGSVRANIVNGNINKINGSLTMKELKGNVGEVNGSIIRSRWEKE